jgi:hypothetical protein
MQRPGRSYAVGAGLGRLEGGLFRDRVQGRPSLTDVVVRIRHISVVAIFSPLRASDSSHNEESTR